MHNHRSVTPVMRDHRSSKKLVDVFNPIEPNTPNNLSQQVLLTQSQLMMTQQTFNKEAIKKGQPMLNIDEIEEQQESQYCLEQLISPNFQPPQSTISMQKRFQKQNGGTSSTRFQNMQFFGGPAFGDKNYSTFFRKNSSRSNNIESPSCSSTGRAG